jgi:hypothetical protein
MRKNIPVMMLADLAKLINTKYGVAANFNGAKINKVESSISIEWHTPKEDDGSESQHKFVLEIKKKDVRRIYTVSAVLDNQQNKPDETTLLKFKKLTNKYDCGFTYMKKGKLSGIDFTTKAKVRYGIADKIAFELIRLGLHNVNIH